MATIDDENDYYDMHHKRRGKAFVINNQQFEARTRLNCRRGSDVDARRIGKELHDLDFEVIIHHNMKKREMLALVNKGKLIFFKLFDCLKKFLNRNILKMLKLTRH